MTRTLPLAPAPLHVVACPSCEYPVSPAASPASRMLHCPWCASIFSVRLAAAPYRGAARR
jgi:hypothetical protein